MIATLLTLFLVGLGAVVALALALLLVGAALHLTFGLAAFLLFKVAPVLVVGYVLVRLLKPRRPRLERYDYDLLP
jgi:membrane protein implicated in regulation of membrane protease activity